MSADQAIHVFTAHVPLRWADLDAMGYVNNSRYFTFFEQARAQWLQSLSEEWNLAQAGPMLAHASCDFRRPVPYPATLQIDIYAEPPGRTSLKTYYEVRLENDGMLYAHGEAALVWVDADTERPEPLPEAFRAALPAHSS
jgi:acyl-CoA thioester hydrolase